MAVPTMAMGLIRVATRTHPTTTAPMTMAQGCQGARDPLTGWDGEGLTRRV